jgi:uncharacterized membrane protein YkvA (DUF1232 family)
VTSTLDWGLLGGIALGLIAVWVVLVGLLWVLRPRDVRLRELVRIVPDLLRLVRGLIADPTVSLGPRLALVGLLIWLLNPIDLIPEFIPVVGPLDDVIVGVIVLRYVRRSVGLEELQRRWPGTAEGFALLSGILGSSAGDRSATDEGDQPAK